MNANDREYTDAKRPAAPPDPAPVWYVIANVAEETRRNPGSAEVQRGTKHFPPGARVCSRSVSTVVKPGRGGWKRTPIVARAPQTA